MLDILERQVASLITSAPQDILAQRSIRVPPRQLDCRHEGQFVCAVLWIFSSSQAAAQVQLSQYKADEERQLWRVIEHEVPPHLKEAASISAASDDGRPDIAVSSGPTETLVISEDKDAITTTRTTTTVTTVTTVTKTPRAFTV